MKKRFLYVYLSILTIFWFFISLPLHADQNVHLSKGQKIYVPAYSHIYIGNREKPYLLTVTLSIRNIDPINPIKIVLIDYYQSEGKLLEKYVNSPTTLGPLGSLRFVIPERDKTGGSGANFLVEWISDQYVNPPIVETIMIGTKGQQGISFTSRGQEIITPDKTKSKKE